MSLLLAERRSLFYYIFGFFFRGYFMNTSDEESESVDDPGVATPSSTPRVSLASRGQRDSISSSALGDEDIGHPAKRQAHFWCI